MKILIILFFILINNCLYSQVVINFAGIENDAISASFGEVVVGDSIGQFYQLEQGFIHNFNYAINDDVVTSINNVLEPQLTMYQTNNKIVIQETKSILCKVEIFGINGRLIYNSSIRLNEGYNYFNLDFLSSGIYIFRLNERYSLKFIVIN